jgi:hypothetical protein
MNIMHVESLEGRSLFSALLPMGHDAGGQHVLTPTAKTKVTLQTVASALQFFGKSDARVVLKSPGQRPVTQAGMFFLNSNSSPTAYTLTLAIPDFSLAQQAGVLDPSVLAPFPTDFSFKLSSKQPLNLFNISRRIGKNTIKFTGVMNKSLTAISGSLVVHMTGSGTQTYTYSAAPAVPFENITTLTFDDLPGGQPGMPLGSLYESKGIVFDGSGFVVKNNTNPDVVVPTSPNFLDLDPSVQTTASLHFEVPGATTPATVSYFAFDNAGLTGVHNGWYNGLTITTRDINGDIIGVFTVAPYGPQASRPVFQLSISEPGIHSIDFAVIPNPYSSGALAPIDDMSFSQPVAAS